jgi:hypothetical protein
MYVLKEGIKFKMLYSQKEYLVQLIILTKLYSPPPPLILYYIGIFKADGSQKELYRLTFLRNLIVLNLVIQRYFSLCEILVSNGFYIPDSLKTSYAPQKGCKL